MGRPAGDGLPERGLIVGVGLAGQAEDEVEADVGESRSAGGGESAEGLGGGVNAGEESELGVVKGLDPH